MSPTARSLLYLRRRGCLAATVERWNAYAKVRQDLFGFGDILAASDGPYLRGALIVQACVTGDQSKRLEKIRTNPKARRWLKAGNHIQIMAWSKRGQREKRKLWSLSLTTVTLTGHVTEVVG